MDVSYWYRTELRDYQLSECSLCGVAVVDEQTHTAWHENLSTLNDGER